MQNKLIKQICELLKVKSIITLISFIAFFNLSMTSKLDTDNFMLILGMITTYFFNKERSDSKDE